MSDKPKTPSTEETRQHLENLFIKKDEKGNQTILIRVSLPKDQPMIDIVSRVHDLILGSKKDDNNIEGLEIQTLFFARETDPKQILNAYKRQFLQNLVNNAEQHFQDLEKLLPDLQ